jgi:lysophospholipase L1-like esterase
MLNSRLKNRFSLILIMPLVSSAAGGQITVGVMGDSYSDEYRTFGPGLKNWVEILAETAQVDFGPFAEFPSEDPRGLGAGSFTYNFARGGENTNRLLSGNKDFKPQFQYFIQAVQAGKLEYGILEIGGNDLLGGAINGEPMPGLFTATGPNEVTLKQIQGIVDRIERALKTIAESGESPVKMILTTLPDLGSVPYVLWETKGLTADHRKHLRLHVQAFNRKIESLAKKREFPVLSLWDWWEDARSNRLKIGHRTIDVMNRAPVTTDPAKLGHFFLADGIHPTPIAQALIANRFLEVIENHFGDHRVRVLDDRALLALSGLGGKPADSDR